MFGCYETVTLWKKSYNAEKKLDEYTRSVIPVKCKWRMRENLIAAESGAVSKRYANVIIPCDGDYRFNGKTGDYLALGEHGIEITGVKPYTASDVKKLLSPNFLQIEYVKDDTNSPVGKRYKVEGVV